MLVSGMGKALFLYVKETRSYYKVRLSRGVFKWRECAGLCSPRKSPATAGLKIHLWILLKKLDQKINKQNAEYLA